MTYTARWGPKGFLVSPTKIVPFDGLSASVAVKSNGDSGSAPTDTRGLEAQKIAFSVTYLRSVGVDPRAQFEEWKSLVGQAHPLYIGEKRFGPAKMMLSGVEMSDVLLTNSGEFLKLTLSISLEEHVSDPATKARSSSGSKSASASASSNTTASNAAAVYEQTVAEKQAALNAGASSGDRKRIGMEMVKP